MHRLAPIWPLALIVLGITNLIAFYAGTEAWFDWGFWPSFALMIGLLAFRDIGGIALSVIAFYGAWRGWSWEWWQALLLTFPTLCLIAFSLLAGGVMSLIKGWFPQRPAAAPLALPSTADVMLPAASQKADAKTSWTPIVLSIGALVILLVVAFVGTLDRHEVRTVEPVEPATPALVDSPPVERAPPAFQPVSQKQIRRAIYEARKTYVAGGLSQLSKYSMDCYRTLEETKAYDDLDFCVAFDLVSSLTAKEVGGDALVRPGSYFGDVAQRARAAATSVLAGGSDPDARLTDTENATAEALRLYALELDAAKAAAQVSKPSFDCTGVSNAALKLVCTDDALASADRALAAAYTEALARVADPASLRASQREWIAARNALSTQDELMDAYARRLAELAAMT